jgi:Tol biopolymer transport system component
MALVAGTRLGPYEVISAIGAGGMGEVYRARDTRLDRFVAIKVLPERFAQNREHRLRFEREARTISRLNHPHICTLYDIGEETGVDFLVMEYLEGETLDARLSKGALPPKEAMQFAVEICDALEKAHRHDIVHRDLKPANIFLTKSGAKLMDFGLAKPALSAAEAATLTGSTEKALTSEGALVGTIPYMSPEQLQGKEADVRSDLFAFGAMLYEMLAGRRPFGGKTSLSVLSAILEHDPEPLAVVKPSTPPALDRLVRQCLAKNPDERWQTAHDLRAELEWIAASAHEAHSARPAARGALLWGLVALILLAAIAWNFRAAAPSAAAPMMRLSVDLGPEVLSDALLEARISPDGKLLAFVGRTSDGQKRLAVRSLQDERTNFIPGTDGAEFPFFSPDGQWLGFFSDARLKKVSIASGVVVTLADPALPHAGATCWGASWGDDQNIIYSPGSINPLVRVSATGGRPEPVTTVGENGDTTHRWPQVLPGSQAVLFTSSRTTTGFDNATIEVLALKTRQRKVLVHGGYAGRYIPAPDGTGYLLYLHEGALFGIRFDPASLVVHGSASPLVEGVAGNSDVGAGQFDISDNGILIYRSGSGPARKWPIVWMDASGRIEPLLSDPDTYYTPRLSPDGAQLAVSINQADKGQQIHLYDWRRGVMSQLTFTDAVNIAPVWTPDGKYVVFQSSSPHGYGIALVRADGSGPPQRLAEHDALITPTSFSPDGKHLAYFELNPETGFDIGIGSFDGSDPEHPRLRDRKLFLNTPAYEWNPVFSPDGRWLAYASSESGRNEIYVRPYPGPGGKSQVSINGGNQAVWSRDGKQIFYKAADARLMVASYRVQGGLFVVSKPRVWSAAPIGGDAIGGSPSLSRDGTRFAVFPRREFQASSGTVHITFVTSFLSELQRRVK